MIVHARQAFGSCIFREVLILACRAIWEQLNGVIFDNVNHSLAAWRVFFRREFSLVTLRAKANVKDLINSWSSHLM
ncbi:hypothetical protein HU200_044742 [Digitaria exilis]|uniref:Uncharacterized protein n=1 Tax=Digitaria exilis TaxID=1010633 RepID=A0A835AYW4_9POAL|nr:hypothetical protein HU200_044742 [Digitaria exilis]